MLMEQQDVFYDGAEYIETVSVGINTASFNLGSLSHPKSRTACTDMTDTESM